jgi:two-component sensor histidine kinase/PAS domain-containing protein
MCSGATLNLSQRLFVFAVIGLLPVFAVVGLLEVQLREAREQEVREVVLRQSRQATSEMERLAEGMRTLLTAVATAPVVTAPDPAGCSIYLAALAASLPQVSAIAVFDMDGDPVCQNAPRPQLNYADRDYFRRAVAERGFVIGVFTRGKAEPDSEVLPFAMPLLGRDGRATGVVAAALRLSHLQSIIGGWSIPAGGSLTIADREGTILARNPAPERFVGTRIPDEFVRRWVQAVEPGVEQVRSQDGTLRILAYKPAALSPAGIYVSTGVSYDEAFAVVDSNWGWNLALLAAGILGALVASFAAARSLIGRPVQDLLALARAWSRGETSTVARPIPTAEFEAIAAALDAMGHDIEARSAAAARQQELLVSELNHRVKNTLALVQAIGSQTAGHARDPAEFNERFGERIRSLARTHDLLTVGSWTGVALRGLVEAEIAATPGSDRVEVSGPDVQVPPGLAVSISLILHELATNAVKYGCLSQAGGRLSVAWTIRRDGGEVLDLTWSEVCAARVPPASAPGFGSRLIARTVASIGSGGTRLTPEGLEFSLSVPLDGWRPAPAVPERTPAAMA